MWNLTRIPHLKKDGPYDNWFCNGEVASPLRSFTSAGERFSEPENIKPKGSLSDVPAGRYDPHAEATYPESQLILNEILSGGSLSERALIVGQNCARLYNFQTYLRQQLPFPLIPLIDTLPDNNSSCFRFFNILSRMKLDR